MARALADGLEARGIDYAVGGALALNEWGVPRGTADMDKGWAYVRSWVARLAGERDVRLTTWDELTASADAALRAKENGWKPPDLAP